MLGYPGSKDDVVQHIYSVLRGLGRVLIDPFAGSGSVCVYFRKRGWDVLANDLCFYSYCILRGVQEKMVVGLTKGRGFFCETYGDSETGEYIDGTAKLALSEGSFRSLACLGYAIIRTMTYRGVRIDRKRISRVTPKMIETRYRNAHTKKLPVVSAFRVENRDATDFLRSLVTQRPEDSVVYLDPAWPWYDGTPANQYRWLAAEVSSILAQKRLPPPRMPTSADIMPRFRQWLSLALRIADVIAVSTQSTNYPPPEMLKKFLERMFGRIDVYKFEVPGHLRRRGRTKVEEWLFVIVSSRQ